MHAFPVSFIKQTTTKQEKKARLASPTLLATSNLRSFSLAISSMVPFLSTPLLFFSHFRNLKTVISPPLKHYLLIYNLFILIFSVNILKLNMSIKILKIKQPQRAALLIFFYYKKLKKN